MWQCCHPIPYHWLHASWRPRRLNWEWEGLVLVCDLVMQKNGAASTRTVTWFSTFPLEPGSTKLQATSASIKREAAISQYEELGQDAFLDKYDFHSARSYLLVRNGTTSPESGCGGSRFDFPDGAGHGCADVFGGWEGLADLGRQAAPLGDGQWGAEAAQGDFHGDVVTTDDQQHPQRGIVAALVAQVVVDKLYVEVELANVFGFEAAELQLEHHEPIEPVG